MMRRSIQNASVACGAVVASAALAVTTATGAAAVTTAVAVGGLGTPDMHEVVIAPLLGGKLDRENEILDGVEWPAQAGAPGSSQLTLGQSITVGIANLNTHFDAALARLATGEQFTVVGFSAGSLVVNDFMRELALDSTAPTKSQVKFILVADSSRQALIKSGSTYNPRYDYTYRPAPETVYDIDVVTGEYDGAADMPDRWWNVLAVVNAIAGGLFVHVPMMFSDYEAVTPEDNITTVTNSKGGVTTTYLVPTKTLPLVQLLPFLKSQEASLKAKIDAGYSRNDDRLAATAVARSSAAPVVESDAVEEAADTTALSNDAAGDEVTVTTTKTRSDKNADLDEEIADEDTTDGASAADEEAEAQEDADSADSADAVKDDESDTDDTDAGDTTTSDDSDPSAST